MFRGLLALLGRLAPLALRGRLVSTALLVPLALRVRLALPDLPGRRVTPASAACGASRGLLVPLV